MRPRPDIAVGILPRVDVAVRGGAKKQNDVYVFAVYLGGEVN